MYSQQPVQQAVDKVFTPCDFEDFFGFAHFVALILSPGLMFILLH
jgi:hypothetical protein